MKKWIIGLVCGVVGVTAAWGDLSSPATLPIEWAGETGYTTAAIDALTGWDATGLTTPYANSTKFDGAGDKIIIYFDGAPGTLVCTARRSDASELAGPYEATIQESADNSSWSTVRTFDGSELNGTPVEFTNTLQASTRYVKFEYVTKPSGQNFGVGSVQISSGGPAVFSVNVDKTDGFTVEQGTQDAIVATGQNGAEPYDYDWDTDMAVGDYTASGDTFTILATAAVGEYYATVTATDDESETADKTVNFSVIAPPDYYAITITPPVNGSVTTTPAEEAAENSTVTINATPADGYAVGTITVTAADESNVPVTGNTFTMPSQDVTVTVTFVEFDAETYVVDFEGEGETKAAYASATVNLSGMDWDLTDALIGTDAADWKNGVRSARMRGYGTSVMTMLEDLPGGVGTISFKYRRYGTAAQVDWKVEYSTNGGADWTQVGSDFTAPATDEVQTFTEAINSSGNTRVRIKRATETGTSNRQLNIDDITMTPGGPAGFSVGVNKTDGFTVEQGTQDAIVATAQNGAEPYDYDWATDMTVGDYTASGDTFTILSTAALGSYYATVTATDDESETADKTVNFSVIAPPDYYAITITPPANGTVTTTPAEEAAENSTVTINATPADGYAVGTITVTAADESNVTVTGNTFTMPSQDVTVTVTFVESSASGELIISQYYEGAGSDKWIEIYNPGSSAVDFTAGGYRLGIWANAIRESWKTNGAPTGSAALTGSLAAGGTFLLSHTSATNPLYATADMKNGTVCNFNGDDSLVLFTGETFAFANVVDTFGLTGNTAANTSFVRKVTITTGVNTDFNAADWDQFTYEQVDAAAEGTNERLGYHSTGPAVFSVGFDKTEGFTLEQGAGGTITATAANGTPEYSYGWTSTLGAEYRTAAAGVFTILATAPIGDYSAEVVATDSSDPVQSVTNSLNFSVVAPPTKYAITIVTNAPANGTVTTDPATEAAEGVSVTVNAVPGDGFAVESILVNGGAVAVNGNAFVMPAEPVTVTVNFMVYVAPDVLIDFEDYTGSYAWNEYVAGGVTWTMTNVFAGNTVDDAKNGTKAGRFENNRGGAGNPATMTSTAFAEPVTGINFWYANFGVNDGGAFKVQVCDDGTSWQDVGEAEYNPDSTTLVQGTINSIPAGMTYVQFITTAGSAQRVNIDDIGIFFGEPVFGVSLNKSNGFEVQEGQSDAIVATAGNGTAPYTYGWGSTLGATHYTASGDTFTILATAPTGSYSATVTATDSSEPAQEAQRTVTFSVVGLPPGQPAVTFIGSLTGTVDVRLELTLGVTNTTFIEFQSVSLKDPLGVDIWDWDYSNFPPIFAFTPDQTGNWTLTAVANTTSGIITNGVTLTISEGGGGDEPPPIPAITFVAGTGFSFELPAGHTVARVEGADAAVAGEAFTWTLLSSPTDYEVVGTQVTIKSAPQDRRLIRVVFNVTP